MNTHTHNIQTLPFFTMAAAALGLTGTGIASGGMIAGAQAAAMTGGSVAGAVLAPLAGPIFLAVGAAGAAGAGIAVGVQQLQNSRVLPTEPTGFDASLQFAVLAHDFGTVLVWSVDTREEADHLLNNIHLRRFGVQIGDWSVIYDDRHVPWREFGHAGPMPIVDNDMRRHLEAVMG